MASTAQTLRYATQFDPQTGKAVAVADGIVRVTAPNASDYTYTGTNTFILGHDRLAVLDPGPDSLPHLVALTDAIAGRPVTAILLTHTHRDHSASARKFAQQLGVPVWFGGRHRLSRPLRRFEVNPIERSSDFDLVPDRILADGEEIEAGDLRLSVHATPGHAANHLAFGVVGTNVLLTGDHIMGWNTTLVSPPDGSMADYFASLDRVIALPYRRYLPAHGDEIADGPDYARRLRDHRQFRNQQMLDAVARGARTIGEVVSAIYPTQPAKVRMAARMTMSAHMEYLEAEGLLRVKRSFFGTRLYPARQVTT